MFINTMEGKLINGMSQLNCLLEKRKQLQERSIFKSFDQSKGIENNINIFRNDSNYYNISNCKQQEKPQTSVMNKVYVNPNYKYKKNVIHVNPNVQIKSSIYINPKLIKTLTTNQSQQTETNFIQHNPLVSNTKTENKISVHINPKLMTRLIYDLPDKSTYNISDQINIQKKSLFSTVPIKDTKSNFLLSNIEDKYISSIPSKQISNMFITSDYETRLSSNYIVKSKPNNGNVFAKNYNSNLVSLSQRKLVRIKKSPKLTTISTNTTKLSTISKKKFCSGLRKIKSSQKNLNAISHLKNLNNVKLIKSIDKNKINWYNKFDKTRSISCRKKIISTKKVINNCVGLISIGGIMYETSRNQLIRSNSNVSSIKRKCNLVLNKYNQYYSMKNGTKLLKIDLTKKKNHNSLIKTNSSISSVKNYKTNVSNKVKQRSLQILRNKMRKNNQPCLLFQKFGYCANLLAKTCPKVHDKKQVALCKNFLQQKCFLDNCQLSHNIGPEKMPTCKYFLDGCCNRDGCPYLHVKVSSKNPICVEFLRGYCSQGNECQKRHIHACPDFDKNGKCSKGKFCQYPHKSPLSEIKRMKIVTCRKSNLISSNELKIISTKPKTIKCRKRYYDKISEELNQKREKLLKLVKVIKDVQIIQSNRKYTSADKNIINEKDSINCERKSEMFKKQRSIGPLPAYIPIN